MSGGDVKLGTQGWSYRDWVGPFYPSGTRSSAMLNVYQQAFRTVEVDSTAYAIPTDPTVQEWCEQVDGEFQFALKLPQVITHERRLRECDLVLRKFVDRVRPLGSRLGPILVQLSSAFRPSNDSRDALEAFLAILPPDLRWAIEFRHPGWMIPPVTELLTRSGVALALADGRWIQRSMIPELALEPTAPFGYVRWLGSERLPSEFSEPILDRSEELNFWAEVITGLASRVERVYGYASNKYEGHAPHTVRELQQRLGLDRVEPSALRQQGELF